MERVFQTIPAGSSLIATTPYRMFKMDLKKIMALAMIVFLAFPNLTMVRADGLEDGAGLADVIERARLYLSKVRTLAENLATEYPGNDEIHGYLNEINESSRAVKYYLDQASDYLDEGDINSTARNLAAARNILGRVKGLLNSMVKAHKVTRVKRFTEQVRHRIKGIVDKVERLRGRFSEGRANKAKASMGFILGNMPQIGDNPSDGDVNDAIDNLEDTIEEINEALGTLDGDTSTILEAMDRIEAKIWVLKASAERLKRKGVEMPEIEELQSAETLLKDIIELLEEGDEGYMEDAETLLEQAEDLVSEASSEIRGIRKEYQNKGSKGKGNG